MLKTFFGILIVIWMMVCGLRYGLRVIPLLLVIGLIVVLINLAIHRSAVR